jgi:hypothetical protein
MLPEIFSRHSTRPQNHYAPLREAGLRMPSEERVFPIHATNLVKAYERAGLQPDSRWYRTKDYELLKNPTVAPMASGRGPSGAKGAGGTSVSTIRGAFGSLLVPVPLRPSSVGGEDPKKRYDYAYG